MSRRLLLRFIKFGFVGLTGILINSFMLWFGHQFISLSLYVAGIFAVMVAIFTNYSLNDLWTWSEHKRDREYVYFNRLWRYYTAASLGALINYFLLLFFTKIMGLYYLISNLIGILAGMSSNFLLSERWVFKRKKNQRV